MSDRVGEQLPAENETAALRFSARGKTRTMITVLSVDIDSESHRPRLACQSKPCGIAAKLNGEIPISFLTGGWKGKRMACNSVGFFSCLCGREFQNER